MTFLAFLSLSLHPDVAKCCALSLSLSLSSFRSIPTAPIEVVSRIQTVSSAGENRTPLLSIGQNQQIDLFFLFFELLDSFFLFFFFFLSNVGFRCGLSSSESRVDQNKNGKIYKTYILGMTAGGDRLGESSAQVDITVE